MSEKNEKRLLLASILAGIIYGIYNVALGVVVGSWWFFVLSAYYFILCASRFVVLYSRRIQPSSERFTGIMLIIMSSFLLGMVILSAIKDRGTSFHMIAMLGIATYTFTKLTLAIIGVVKLKGQNDPVRASLKSISFAEAFVAIFALQRSMLVTFEGMVESEIKLFNILTGSGVCVLVLLMGLKLVLGIRFTKK